MLGSPPRMRGKLQEKIPVLFDDRITPAYAGKTTGCKYADVTDEDHPRVCGENSLQHP